VIESRTCASGAAAAGDGDGLLARTRARCEITLPRGRGGGCGTRSAGGSGVGPRWSPRGAWEIEVVRIYADGTIGSIEVTFADGSRWGPLDVAAPPGQVFTKDEAASTVQSLIDQGEFDDIQLPRLPSRHDS
jgi:hypothetical protein